MFGVRDALEGILLENLTSCPSSRLSEVRRTADLLVRAPFEETPGSLAESILSIISNCFPSALCLGSQRSWCGAAQSAFHSARTKHLPPVWARFFKTIDTIGTVSDPLLQQTVNQKIFDYICLHRLSALRVKSSAVAPLPKKKIGSPQFTPEEENALRFAVGYLPFKLLKRHKTGSSEKSIAYCQFLREIQAVSASSDHEAYTFHDYTSKWLEKIDRGALFRVSDSFYCLFGLVEANLRSFLPEQLSTSPNSSKEEIVAAIVSDEDILRQWNELSSTMQSRDIAVSLLHELVVLWLTMRGFSMCSLWMEQYKRAKKAKTKKSRSLRTDLKK